MRRVAVLLAVSLSAGLMSAQEPKADDRIPIPATIDTWYRAEQNKEHVGWFHESLSTTTMRNYRYEYLVESEYDYTITDADGEQSSFHISEVLKAQLEEDFDIYDMEYTLNYDVVQYYVQLKTYAESEERVIKYDIKTDPPVAGEYKFPISETIHLYLNPMLYRLRQNGSLAQPTRLREKVFLPGQEQPISVSYSAGALASKDILGKSVKVSQVIIDGWDRGALAPISRIWVDKYGRMVEAETGDRTMAFMMTKDETSARGVKRGIASKNRRDPFSKRDAGTPITPTKKDKPTEGEGPGRPTQVDLKLQPDEFDKVLAETKALIPKLREELSRQFPEEARATYLKILANYKGLFKLVETDLIKRTEVEKVREEAEQLYGGVKKLKDQILIKVERINDFYLNENLEGIDRDLAELKAMRQAPELFRSEDGLAELESAIRTAEGRRKATEARIELAKKTLVLTGTITATEVVQDIVKFDLFISGARLAFTQPVSVRRMVTLAVINDEAYREGDIVQRESVKVQKIQRHAVEVEYKGEVRQVVLRKS
jgi:hypothetical protein